VTQQAHTNHSSTPGGFPMRGVAETGKAPSLEGALSIFVTGQKKSAFSNFLKPLHYCSTLEAFVSSFCA